MFRDKHFHLHCSQLIGPGGRKTVNTLLVYILLGQSHALPWFYHSSYTDSEAFIPSPDLFLSPTPYLYLTAGYLSWMSTGALNSRDPTLNSFVLCLNFLFSTAPIPHLYSWLPTHLTPTSEPGHHPSLPSLSPSPILVTRASNSTP